MAKKTGRERSPSVSSDDDETLTILNALQVVQSISSSAYDGNDSSIREVSTRRDSSSSSSSDSDGETQPSTSIKPIQKPRTNRGVLLQHRIKLYEDSIKWIEKSGQKMDENFFSFTTEEDRKIKENWQKFAGFQKFDGHIFEFLGYDSDGLQLKPENKPKNVPSSVYNGELWPFLCRGLDNRFAKLVRLRISYIFHPYFREEQDWDMKEVKRRLDNDESMAEISEALRIPPRFLERKFVKPEKVEKIYLEPKERIFMLKMLYESVIESEDNKFCPKNFDWKLFRNKCRENSLDPPEARTINQTFQKRFALTEKAIFQYLDPPPTLKKKLNYVHEAYLRYSINEKANKRKSELPLIRYETLFTIVFEDYNKNGAWNPPPALEKYAGKVDMEKIRERVDTVIQKRKRLSETPKAKISVIVKKRIKMEDLRRSVDSGADSTTRDQELEISSIRGDTSSITTGSVTFDQSEDPNDPLTEFEMSTIDNTSTINETILAGGGAGIPRGIDEKGNDSSLGGLHLSQNSQTTKKAEESVNLDTSQDIWSQLVGSQ